MLKNIIFDITGVILKFNRDDLLSHFYKGKDYALLKEKLFFEWERLDEDTITLEEYYRNVLNSLPVHLHSVAKSVLNNWEYYMYFNHEIIELIRELKQKDYKLFILSNMTRHFIERDYRFPFFREFDDIIYSAYLGLLKPNPAIYKHVLVTHNLTANECLFIDDIKENLAGAARFNINTFHYRNNTKDLRKVIFND
ncbi:MAG: HAD family phosphatase [Clostridiales bacterium]|nr:HAD family phosphatase [Clostridiales bacterium]